MTIQEAMREGFDLLSKQEVDTPLLDSTVILSECLDLSKERLYASLQDSINTDTLARYRRLLEKRCRGIPVSYIREKKEFFGLDFKVNRQVFIPRPATETLVESVLDRIREAESLRGFKRDGKSLSLHDICTGSGCIAITLKYHVPSLDVSCSDISEEALDICRLNSRVILGTSLPVHRSSLLENIRGHFDFITGNPPYLENRIVDSMIAGAWPEPENALRAGDDGLLYETAIISQAKAGLNRGGTLFLEADPQQMEALQRQMEEAGYRNIRIIKDLANLDRVICGSVP